MPYRIQTDTNTGLKTYTHTDTVTDTGRKTYTDTNANTEKTPIHIRKKSFLPIWHINIGIGIGT